MCDAGAPAEGERRQHDDRDEPHEQNERGQQQDAGGPRHDDAKTMRRLTEQW